MPTHPKNAAMQLLFDRTDFERAASMPYHEQWLPLDRMRRLLSRLDNPDRSLAIVHLAGTKGKGSTAAMLSAVLSEAGYHAGLYTSPHLQRVEERIAIDGTSISEAELVALIEDLRPEIEAFDQEAHAHGDQGATFFELITAIALTHFAHRGVDVAILETGLGGRLDATSVCRPLLSIITSISLDHTRQLGNTLAEIAGEKAGIIKEGVPVVSGVTQQEPREVIRAACRRQGCPLQELGLDFDVQYRPPQRLDLAATPGEITFVHKLPEPASAETFPLLLPGEHQAANAALAIAGCEALRRQGWTIPPQALGAALGRLTYPARVEVVARRPTVILDAAHNAASISALLKTLDVSFHAATRHLIFATTQEKDLLGMLALLLPKFDNVIFTRYLGNPRYVPIEELVAVARKLDANNFQTAADPAAAWRLARDAAAPDDLICITGSFFLASEMRAFVSF